MAKVKVNGKVRVFEAEMKDVPAILRMMKPELPEQLPTHSLKAGTIATVIATKDDKVLVIPPAGSITSEYGNREQQQLREDMYEVIEEGDGDQVAAVIAAASAAYDQTETFGGFGVGDSFEYLGGVDEQVGGAILRGKVYTILAMTDGAPAIIDEDGDFTSLGSKLVRCLRKVDTPLN